MANTLVHKRAPQRNRESAPARNGLVLPVSPAGIPHPDMRIVQGAVFDFDDENALDWMAWLNNLGIKNKGKGRARALGSVSVTLIKATEMGKMLEDKHPGRYHNPRTARAMQYDYGKRIMRFMRAQSGVHALQTIEQAHRNHESERSEGITSDYSDTAIVLSPDMVLNDEAERSLRRHNFGQSSYTVRPGIKPYGRLRAGLDLSLNDPIYEMRRELLTFMRRDLKLNTGLVDVRYEAHASCFDYLEHRRPEQTVFVYDAEQPQQMSYTEPRVEFS